MRIIADVLTIVQSLGGEAIGMRNFYQTSVLVRVTRTNGPEPQCTCEYIFLCMYVFTYIYIYVYTPADGNV